MVIINNMGWQFDETEGSSIQATANSKQAVTKVTGEARGVGDELSVTLTTILSIIDWSL